MSYYEKFRQLGLLVPELVMPCRGVDNTKFACIACDQYNAQPEYWDEVAELLVNIF